jgi:cytochrome c oxidase subunit IV
MAKTTGHDDHIPVSTFTWVFGWLMVLLAVTVVIAHYDFGKLNVFAALFIATIKAILVVMYFMQVKRSITMIKIYAGAAAVWLVIGVVLTFSDYLTRVTLR